MARKHVNQIKKVTVIGDISKSRDAQTKLLLELLPKYIHLIETESNEKQA